VRKIIAVSTVVHLLLFVACTKTSTTELPKFSWVTDESDILTPEQEEKLGQELKALKDNIGSEMAILTVDSLGGMTIEQFSLNKANTWGLGRKDYNDGVLITVDMKTHQIRIEVGYGLETIIKDEIAARIIRDDMVEPFRSENYYEGFHRAVSHMVELITSHRNLIGQKP